MEPIRVGVVMGGTSSEREISLSSGDAVAEALERRGHDVVRIVLGNGVDALDSLAAADMDAAFLALHGRQGEDGCVQGILEMIGVPYTGSGVLASALAMDKVKSKELFRLHNIGTPPYYVIQRERLDAGEALELMHGSFGFPVVVKPRREGSSVGVCKASNMKELAIAVEEALLYDESVLVERFVKGAEVAVALLDGKVLGSIEIVPEGELFDFGSKYRSSKTEYHLPARISEARLHGIFHLAERAAEALDVRGPARVDMILTEGMNEYVLELNTLPGMTERSLFPRVAASAGYDFESLCEQILAGARLDSGLKLETIGRHGLASEPNIWQEVEFDESELAWMPSAGRHKSAEGSGRKVG